MPRDNRGEQVNLWPDTILIPEWRRDWDTEDIEEDEGRYGYSPGHPDDFGDN